MKNTIAFLFIIIGFSCNGHELDSLLKKVSYTNSEKAKIDLWEQIIHISVWQTSEKETKNYIDQLNKYSHKKKNKYGIATSDLLYAKYYERLQEMDKAKKYANDAYNSFYRQNNKLGMCKALRQQGFNAYKISNIEKATELAYKALDLSISIKNPIQEGLCLGQVGMFLFNSQPQEGIKLEKQSFELLQKINAKREASIVAVSLSGLYINLNEDRKSLSYLDTFFILQKEFNDIGLLAEGKANAAIAYNTLGMTEKAEQLIEESGAYFLKIDSEISHAKYFRLKSTIYNQSGKYQKAIEMAKKALSLISAKDGLETEKGILQYTLFLSYKAIKQYELAIEAYENAVNHEFNVYDDQTQIGIADLKEKYETEQKEEKIKLLQEQNRTKDVRLKARTYFIIALSLVLILIVLAIVFIRRQSKLKQQKKTAELENKALRAQMNPHFIFNALNSIQRIYVEGNIEKANDFMGDFAQLMRKVLENSSNSKISIHEELETLRLYMDLEKLRCKNQFSYTISVDENISIFNAHIPPLIIQPFVENAIWHGILSLKDRKGEINISLRQKSTDSVLITIADNGVGFSNDEKSEKHSSKGMKITEQRIGEKIAVSSENGKGTIISFTVKTTL